MAEEQKIASKFRDDIIELHNHTEEFYETALRIQNLYSFMDIHKLKDYVMEMFEKIYASMKKIKTALDIE